MYPVWSFMKYKSHLNDKCERLFQRPSHKINSLKWYDCMPLGHTTIGKMMAIISEKKYTNNSLRATLVNLLDNTGEFASRHIMSVTGH